VDGFSSFIFFLNIMFLNISGLRLTKKYLKIIVTEKIKMNLSDMEKKSCNKSFHVNKKS
jgi:hypothetical protein